MSRSNRLPKTDFFLFKLLLPALALVFLLAGSVRADDALNHWYYRNTNLLERVRYLGGQFIGVGNNGLLMTSPDGSNWTKQVTGTTAKLTGAAYGNLLFPLQPSHEYVVVGAGGTILVSSNAVSWTNVGSGNYGNLNDVAFGEFQFVAVTSRSVASQSNVITSQDGVHWSGTPFPGGGTPQGGMPYICSAICYDAFDAAFITAGGTEFADDVWISYDAGNTWTNAGFSDQIVNGIAYGNGTIVMVGWEGWPYESTNGGTTWSFVENSTIDPSAYNNPGGAMVGNDIVFANGEFVVCEVNDFPETLLVTTNGVNWQRRTPIKPNINVTSIAFGNGTYVGVSPGSDQSLTPGGIYQSLPVSTPIITASVLTNTNAVDLLISGLAGQEYRLQSSLDMTNWSTRWMFTNNAPLMEFIDPITNQVPRFFYRVVSP